MATFKTNELLGSADKLSTAITQHAALLAAKGITVQMVKDSIDAAKGGLDSAEAIQEAAKQTVKSATTDVNNAATNTYDVLTSIVDVCAGAVGKKTAAGRQFKAIREQLNRSRRSGAGDVGGTS